MLRRKRGNYFGEKDVAVKKGNKPTSKATEAQIEAVKKRMEEAKKEAKKRNMRILIWALVSVTVLIVVGWYLIGFLIEQLS